MKTKLLSLLFAVCISLAATAQAPGWQWAQSSTGYAEGHAVESDANGNIYVLGVYSGSTTVLSGTLLPSTDSIAIFIAKYNPQGNLQWVKTFGSAIIVAPIDISFAANGNFAITGYFFNGQLVFDAVTLPASSGGMFVAQFDALGNTLWARSSSGGAANGISIDPSGNTLVTGSFRGNIAFDATTLINADATWMTADIFIAKYDSQGTVIWAKRAGGQRGDYGFSISTDAMGNIHLGGAFSSSVIAFGTTTLTNVRNDNSTDIFVATYDAAGNAVWAKRAGGRKAEEIYGLSTDATGNTFITGYSYSDSLTFGNVMFYNPSHSAQMFLAKYDVAGNLLWARQPSSFVASANAVATDPGGGVIVSGKFYGASINFGAVTVTNMSTYTSTPNNFIARYDAAGTASWARSFMGADVSLDPHAYLCTDPLGNAILTGFFDKNKSVSFGATTFSNSSQNYEFFVAKLGDSYTSIREESNSDLLTSFPNPFSDKVTIQSDRSLDNTTLKLVNCVGATVKQMDNLSGRTITLLRGELPAGIYVMHLFEEDKIISTKKLMITD